MINLSNSHNGKELLLFPFYKWKDEGPKEFNFGGILQLACGGTESVLGWSVFKAHVFKHYTYCLWMGVLKAYKG